VPAEERGDGRLVHPAVVKAQLTLLQRVGDEAEPYDAV
jgi:hypothetical protein